MNRETRPATTFMLRALRPHRGRLLLLVLFSFLAASFESVSIGVLIPVLSNLLDASSGQQLPFLVETARRALLDYPIVQQILYTVLFVVAAVLVKSLFLSVSIHIGYRFSSSLTADLRARAARTLLAAGIEYRSRGRIGDQVEKTVNNTYMVEVLVKFAVESVVNLMTIALLLVLLLVISWKLTLLALVVGLPFALVVAIYARRLPRLGDGFARAGRELTASLFEMLGGIREIKELGEEERELRRLERKIDRYRESIFRLNLGNYLLHPLVDVLGVVFIGIVMVLAAAVLEMDAGLLLTLMIPFLYVIVRFLPVAKQLNLAAGIIASRWPFVEVVSDLVRTDNKPCLEDGNRPFEGLKREIRLDGVTFSYAGDGGFRIDDLSLTIPAGKTTALSGPSGAGKSTVLNLILRLYEPQDGQILVDGVPLDELQIRTYLQRVGVVSQHPFLFNRTVRQNIAFGASGEAPDEEVERAARIAGAHEFIVHLEQGYDTVVGDRGVVLSGGQRQRIALARALLRDPDILILDEATSFLDVETERRLLEALTGQARRKTIVIVSHRGSVLEHADQVIRMKDGAAVT